MQRNYRLFAIIGCLLASSLACGPVINGPAMEATVVAALTSAALNFGPTFEAQQTDVLATANAEFATLSVAGTANAALYWATETAAAKGIAPPPIVATAEPASGSSGTGDNVGDWDGMATVVKGTINIGVDVQDHIPDLFTAHNWVFQGNAGQVITISVEGVNSSDPRIRLFDPFGEFIEEDDDGGGGYNSLLTVILPDTGLYTLCIDAFEAGNYILRVTTQ